MLCQIMKEKNLTVYRLAKESSVPYATVNDLCKKKTRIEKSSAETVYRLAKALGVPMEELVAPAMEEEERPSFELFRSSICHMVKEQTDILFLIEVLQKDTVRKLADKKWYPEALYLLAMIDYLSRINSVPICNRYNDLRASKLQEPLFPQSLVLAAKITNDQSLLSKAVEEAIPEFSRFNIIESEVRDVC